MINNPIKNIRIIRQKAWIIDFDFWYDIEQPIR